MLFSRLYVCLSIGLSACSLLSAVYSHTLSVVCFCAFVCFLPEINALYRILCNETTLAYW